MKPVLIHLRPRNPYTNQLVDVRVGSSLSAVHLGYGQQIWETAITTRPVISQRLADGEFGGNIPSAEATFVCSTWNILEVAADLNALRWISGSVVIYQPSDDAATAKVVFRGEIVAADPDPEKGLIRFRCVTSTLFLDKPLLAEEYKGSGGAEGTVDMRGTLKPFGFGEVQNVPLVLIDPVNSIYQVTGYHNLSAVSTVYENGAPFNASAGSFASYSLLRDAVLNGGQWATSIGEGLIRFGAPLEGVATADVTFSGGVLPGQVLFTLASTYGGLSLDQIDTTSFSALSVDKPYPVRWYTRGQVTLGEMIQRIAQSCNWSAFVTLDGQLSVAKALPGQPIDTLYLDGSSVPEISRYEERGETVPFYRLGLSANYNFNVHTQDQLSFGGIFTERGDYDGTATYSEGDIVSYMRAVYIYVLPTSMTGTPTPGTPQAQGVWVQMAADTTLTRLLANKPGFEFNTDGTPLIPGDSITLTAVPPAGESIIWETSPNVTLTGDPGALERTLTVAAFGGNQTVTVTVSTQTQSVNLTLFRLSRVRHRLGPLSARPAAGEFIGERWTATDQDLTYYWNGTAWVIESSTGAPSGTHVAGMPANLMVLSTENEFRDTMSSYATLADFDRNWNRSDAGEAVLGVAAGGKYFYEGNGSGNDFAQISSKFLMPFDPEDIYEVSGLIDSVNSGGASMYVGVIAYNAAGVPLVPSDNGTYCYVVAAGSQPNTGTPKWMRGYIKGIKAVGAGNNVGGPNGLPEFATPVPTGTAYIAWLGIFNYPSNPGQVVLYEARIRKVESTSVMWRGGWVNNVSYRRNDGIVTAEGRTFRSLHDANLNFAPPVSNTSDGHWQLIAGIGATSQQLTDIQTALNQASQASDSVIELFYQPSAPAGSERDLWFDTDDGLWYSYSGGQWVLRRDSAVGQALTNASNALGVANTASGTANTALINAGTAQSTADGKVTTYYQDGDPGWRNNGDLWFRPTYKDGYRFIGGTGWAKLLGDLSGYDLLNGNLIVIGSITTPRMATDSITDSAAFYAQSIGSGTNFAPSTGAWYDLNGSGGYFDYYTQTWVNTAYSVRAVLNCVAGGRVLLNFSINANRTGGDNDLWYMRIVRFHPSYGFTVLPGEPRFVLTSSTLIYAWNFADNNIPADGQYTYQVQMMRMSSASSFFECSLNGLSLKK